MGSVAHEWVEVRDSAEEDWVRTILLMHGKNGKHLCVEAEDTKLYITGQDYRTRKWNFVR